jgi:hypothetical protein
MNYDNKPKPKPQVEEVEPVLVEISPFWDFDSINGLTEKLDKADTYIGVLEMFAVGEGRNFTFDEVFAEQTESEYDLALDMIKTCGASLAMVEDLTSDDKEVAIMAYDDICDRLYTNDDIVIAPFIMKFDALHPYLEDDEKLTIDDFDMDEIYKSISEARKAIKKKKHKGNWTIKEVMSTAKGGVRKMYKTINGGKKKRLTSGQKKHIKNMEKKAHSSKAEDKRQRSRDAKD